jgi:hypothetical protein
VFQKMFMHVHICKINNTAQSHMAWSMERKLSISEVLFEFHNIYQLHFKPVKMSTRLFYNACFFQLSQ